MTIGVFLNPGVCYDEGGKVARYNRSNEFDRTDDRLARFIESEVLPEVEKMKTADGRAILISKDANDRAITGASSSGIAAFTVAWERPDMFSRVYSSVGTFVAMRGGNEYPAIVRKTEPQRLRIFLQDGVNDTWNHIFGDWWEYNQLMSSALNYAGYEFDYKWDRGGHSIYYGTRIYPDVMRWLWRGYPARVQKGWSNNGMLQDILLESEDWKEVVLPIAVEGELFATQDSSVVFASRARIYKVLASGIVEQIGGLKLGERLMGENLTAKGSTLYKNGVKVAEGLSGLKAAQALAEDKYLVLCDEKAKSKNNVWVVNAGCRALAVSPDYRFCVTGEENTHHLISTVIDKAGKILYSEPFYYLHDLSNGTLKPSGSMAFDTKGNLYVATEMGVQVADHNGRVRAILSLPAGRVNSLAFSGNYLFALCGERLFVRQMKSEGHLPVDGKVTYKSQGQG